ncbi:MAG TPA: hypothetical protein EYP10_06315, partial [Armatimonadetes bacterium]|nr:hypothetical protein [Armatimonadota bacterium]
MLQVEHASALFVTNFTTLDWIIVIVYMLGSMAIGIIANRYIRGLSHFIVAGRALRIYLGVATLVGT